MTDMTEKMRDMLKDESEYYLKSRGYKNNGNGFYTNDNPFSDTVWVDKDGRISHSM